MRSIEYAAEKSLQLRSQVETILNVPHKGTSPVLSTLAALLEGIFEQHHMKKGPA
jgi:hypothetical protein